MSPLQVIAIVDALVSNGLGLSCPSLSAKHVRSRLPISSCLPPRLHEVKEILDKKQAYIEKKVDEELAIIKANGTKNKRVALAALKRKKRLEKQLEQIDGE